MALTTQMNGARLSRPRVSGPLRQMKPFTRLVSCRSNVGTETEVSTAVIQITDRDHFRSLLKESGEKNELLVVDYYTTWCGPCKLIAPLVEKMAEEYKEKGVRVAKITCDASNDNKKWAMEVGIKSLPTFRAYRGGSEEHVAQMTGAKIEQLRKLVDEQLAAMS